MKRERELTPIAQTVHYAPESSQTYTLTGWPLSILGRCSQTRHRLYEQQYWVVKLGPELLSALV
jgi:hypothetical protein